MSDFAVGPSYQIRVGISEEAAGPSINDLSTKTTLGCPNIHLAVWLYVCESIQDMGKVVGRQILWLVVSCVDSPGKSNEYQARDLGEGSPTS